MLLTHLPYGKVHCSDVPPTEYVKAGPQVPPGVEDTDSVLTFISQVVVPGRPRYQREFGPDEPQVGI
jgi:hypothetical protein